MRQVIAAVVSWLIIAQPLLAQSAVIEADGEAAAAQRPDVDVASNGVPQVNIVAPNAAGVSHNKYRQFNVGAPGAILNNSKEELAQSQLGGLVQGNANLADSAAASLILNEVTSTRRSLLAGAVEVHGAAADVVLANPNGITCNGCGFINTPRVTLATGTPELGDDGLLANLRVAGGDLLIGTSGADLRAADVFDLIAGRIKVTGAVRAGGDLNLVAGHNSYAYQNGLLTALEADGTDEGLAIDSSLLGGMYAGKITLRATDAGAGVRLLGPLSATAEGMTLSADGSLTLADAQAATTIDAASTSDAVQVTGTLYAGTDVVLEGATGVALQEDATVTAAGDVNLSAETVSLASGALAAAGVAADGEQGTTGTLTVTGTTLDAGEGRLVAGESLQVTAGTIDLTRDTDTETSTLLSLGNVVLDTETLTATHGRVAALDGLTIQGTGGLTLTGGHYTSGTTLDVAAQSITSSADLRAVTDLTVHSRTGGVTNSGVASGDGSATVTAATELDNSGQIFSKGTVSITSGDATSNLADGQIVGDGGVAVTAGSVTNAGQIQAQGGSLTVATAGGLSNSGSLVSLTSADLTVGGAIVNSGDLLVEQELVLQGLSGARSGALSNLAGATINSGSGSYTVASLSNAGTLTAHDSSLMVDATGTVGNSGTITAKTDATVATDGALTNSGSMTAEGQITLSGRQGGRLGALTTTAGSSINGGTGLTIKAASLSNAGDTGSAAGSLDVQLTGDLTNSGFLYSNTNSHYQLDGTFTNTEGRVVAETDLTIEGLTADRAGALTNSSGTIAAVSGELTLKASSLSNDRPTVTVEAFTTTEETTEGTTTTTVVTSGERVTADSSAAARLQAGGDLVIETGALTNRHSQIAATGAVTITADTLTNTGQELTETVVTTIVADGAEPSTTSTESVSSTATISAGGALTATLSGALDNRGHILSSDQATVSSNAAVTNRAAGQIAGDQGVALSGASVSNAGRITAQGSALTIATAGGLTNSGTLVSLTSAEFKVDGDVVNSGALLVEETLTLLGLNGARSGALSNQAGGTINSGSGSYTITSLTNAGTLIAHDSSLTVDATGTIANSGSISSKTDTEISVAGDLTNSGSMIAEDEITIEGREGGRLGTLTTTAGSTLNGGTGLTVKATSLDNAGDTGSAGGSLAVDLTGNLTNTGLLYSNTSSQYDLDGTFSNTAGRVVAETDLTIDGLAGARAGALLNTSGTIAAVTGDLTLKTAALSNDRPTVTVETTVTEEETTEGETTTTVVTTTDRLSADTPPEARLQAGGNLVIDTGALTNRHSRIAAGGTLTVTADSLTNTGQELTETVVTTIATAGAEPVVTSTETTASTATIWAGGALSATLTGALDNSARIFSRDKATVTAGAALTNRATGQIAGAQGVALSGASASNAGHITAQGDALTIATAGALTNSGTLVSLTSAEFQVDGNVVNSGALLVEETLTLLGLSGTRSGALSNQAGATINSGSGSYTVTSLTNAGTLTAHDGSLTVDATGTISNSGNVNSKTDTEISVDGDVTNSGSLIAEGQITLQGRSGGRLGALTTTAGSTLNGGAGLTIKAASLDNAGDAGSAAGSVAVELTGDLTNSGFLYSKTSSQYHLDGAFTNTEGRVVAETALTVEGLTGARAGALTNTSGSIVAVSGDLTLKGASLSNDRPTLDVEAFTTTEETTEGTTTTTVVTSGERVTEDSPPAARLQAGGDLVIDTGALTNNHSTIAATGALTITADSLTNTGRELTETIETTIVTDGEEPIVTTTESTTSTATIWAGGALTATLTGAIDNSAHILSSDLATVTSDAAVTNQAAGQIAGGQGVALTGTSVSNAGRIVAQGSALTIATAGGLTNSGTLVSLTSAEFQVDGAVVNSGDLLVEETLTLLGLNGARSGALSNQAGATINSGSGSYTVASLSNAGTLIAHDTALTLDATGTIGNSGNVSSKTDTEVSLAGDLTNSGSLIAEGDITLEGREGGRLGTLTTTTGSTLNGDAGLTVKATSLSNAGDTGSAAGFIEVELTEELSNTGFLYSYTNSHYRLDGTFTNTEGRVVAQTDLTIEGLTGDRAGALTNTSGSIAAVSGDLTLNSASLSNDRPTVNFETFTTTEETTEGTTTTTVVTSSERVTADSSPAARLQAGGDLTIDTGALTNRYGNIAAGADLTIDADSLTNTGRRITQTVEITTVEEGAEPVVDTTTSEIAVGLIESGGALSITTSGGLDNSGTLFSLTSADLNVDGSVVNSGHLLVEQALVLGGATGTHSGALSNQDGATINSGSGSYSVASLSNAGTLTAHDTTLAIDATGNVTNSGDISAETDLDIALDGNLTNQDGGEILSEGQMTLTGTGGGHLGALTTNEASLINGGDGLTIKAASLTNADRIGSANGALTVELTGNLANTGLLYSGTNSHYRLDGTFTNTEADILAENDLTIEGLTNERAGALTNTSARIEAISGTMTIKVASLTNERAELEFGSTTTGEDPTTETVSAPCIYTPGFGMVCDEDETEDTITTTVSTTVEDVVEDSGQAELLAGRDIEIETGDLTNSFSHIAAIRNVRIEAESVTNVGRDLTKTVATTTETVHQEVHCFILFCLGDWVFDPKVTKKTNDVTTVLEDATRQSKLFGTIHAQGTVEIYVQGELTNHNDIEGYDGEFKDDAIRAVQTMTSPEAGDRALDTPGVDGTLASHMITDPEQTRTLATAIVDAILGDVVLPDGEVSEFSTDRTLLAAVVSSVLGASGITGESDELTTAITDALEQALVDGELGERELVDAVLAELAETQAMAAAQVPSVPLPYSFVSLTSLQMSIDSLLGRTSLFVQQQAPDMPYLIETRPEFIKRDKYLGSDYFLDRVGLLHADQILKRLGDSYVETRLIQDQIFDLTGLRYVAGARDDRSLMQALYDNAVDAHQNLSLTIGIALTPSQIAALGGDIIWLERHTIEGQEVLVPRLYLASSTLENLDFSSARIAGSTTIIDAAHVYNSGTISGTDALAIQTSGDLENVGGSLLSDGNIGIRAGRLFSNQSGIVAAGGNVGIAAGGILNETLKSRDEFDGGFSERMHRVAQISAGGTLHLNAASFIQSIGGAFSSGEGMTLQAGENIAIQALQLERESKSEFDGGFELSKALTNELASIDAGGALTVRAGGDLTVQGADIAAGDDATLYAEGDTTIASVQDYHHDEYKRDTRSDGILGFASTGTDTHQLDAGTDTQRTTVSAGGELTIASGEGDLTLDAVSLQTEEGDITLSAEQGTVSLLSNSDQSSERDYERDEGLLWYTEEDQGRDETTTEHVEIEQGGKLNIVAGKGVVVDFEGDGSEDESLDKLVQSPELAWMQQLRDDPDLEVQWQEVEAAFKEWDYESQGLTATGAALVSLIVGVATGGAVSGAVEGIMGALNITSTAVQSAIHAGLSSLVNQAAVTLVNNQGDLAATLQQLASLETLTSLAGTMLTAGLTTGLTEAAGLGTELLNTAPLADRVSQDIAQGVIAVGVDTAVSTVVEGQDLGDALLGSLRSEAAAILGENVAQEIGAAVENGDMDTAGQLIAHAALGCVTGLIGSDDCASGAGGAVIGEAAALIYEQQIDGWLADAQDGTLSIDEITDQLDAMKDAGVDIARLASGFSVGMAGGNVDVASGAGANAAENNVFWLIPVLIFTLEAVDKALLAHDAAKLAEAALSGNDELASQLATDLAISVGLEMTVGNVIPGSVLGRKIIQKVTKVLRKKGLDDVARSFDRGMTAYHHTATEYVDSILSSGLRKGSYATPTANLSPLQAKIELALPGNTPRNAVLEIDLDGLRRAGYDIPEVTRVRADFGLPGGGYEMNFPYEIPAEFLRIVNR